MSKYLKVVVREQPLMNERPPWLNGLELDFWFQKSGIAVEFQGGQHFVPVYGKGALVSARARDRVKAAECASRRIALARIDASRLSYGQIVRTIKSMLAMAGRSKEAGRLLNLGFDSRAACRPIDIEAVKYRAMIRSRFGCPTSYRAGSEARKVASRKASSPTTSGIPES